MCRLDEFEVERKRYPSAFRRFDTQSGKAEKCNMTLISATKLQTSKEVEVL
jgi:hypothetical protein